MTHIQVQTNTTQKVRLSQLQHQELNNHFKLGISLPLNKWLKLQIQVSERNAQNDWFRSWEL